jgi:hypothetical protein
MAIVGTTLTIIAFCVNHLSLVIADQGVATLSKIGHTKQYNQNGISGSS